MTAKRQPWRATPEGVIVFCRLTPKGGRDAIDRVAELADGSSVLAARVRNAPQDGEANRRFMRAIGGAARRSNLKHAHGRRLEEPAQAGFGFRRSGRPCRQAGGVVGEPRMT
jgi:uncharacterized protein